MAFSDTDKKILQIGIFLAVLIAVILLYYMWGIQRPQIKAHEKQRNKLKAEVDDLQDRYAEMLRMVNQIDKVKKDLGIVKEAAKRLPGSRDRFNFFVELSDLLQLTGVKYSKIVPKKESVKAYYTEIPYEIRCLARYHEFGQFVNMMEQNPRRFMRVKYFTIGNDKNRPSMHPITLGVATFMFNE